MKKISLFSLTLLFAVCTTTLQAQNKTESFAVSGNCGMCKSTIEKAAKSAGATSAIWDEATKQLTVTYKSSTTNTAKIQEKIAAAGYDNAGMKASTSAYEKLHACCKYDRGTEVAKASCCADEATCKDHKSGSKEDCCKGGICTKPGHEGKDCCKDGACTKSGDGKDCCKKD